MNMPNNSNRPLLDRDALHQQARDQAGVGEGVSEYDVIEDIIYTERELVIDHVAPELSEDERTDLITEWDAAPDGLDGFGAYALGWRDALRPNPIRAGCQCEACHALRLELRANVGGSRLHEPDEAYESYHGKRLLVQGEPGRWGHMSRAEMAYILAHAPWAQAPSPSPSAEPEAA